LLALGLLLVGYPLLRCTFDARLLYDILLTLVFLTALFVVFGEGWQRLLGLLLGSPLLAGAWAGYALPALPRVSLALVCHLAAALFLGFTVPVILRAVYRSARVSVDSLCGALCGYVLVGIAFGHLYCTIEGLAPGSFGGSDEVRAALQDESQRHFRLIYFSLVTLATVGYRDITPEAGPAVLHRPPLPGRQPRPEQRLEEIAQTLEVPSRDRLEEKLVDLGLLEHCKEALDRR
jgi:hypothetical protein